MNEKFFLQSKTVISMLIALAVQIGPLLGLSFTADDGALITQNIDTLITALLALLAIYGRVTATSKIKFRSLRGGVNSPWYVGAFALLLMGCITTTTPTTPETPQQAYYAAKATYEVTLTEAADYAALPFCTELVIVNCSVPEVVVKLDEAADKADDAFKQADKVFAAVTSNPLEEETALDAATVALRQLTAILATAAIAEAGS